MGILPWTELVTDRYFKFNEGKRARLATCFLHFLHWHQILRKDIDSHLWDLCYSIAQLFRFYWGQTFKFVGVFILGFFVPLPLGTWPMRHETVTKRREGVLSLYSQLFSFMKWLIRRKSRPVQSIWKQESGQFHEMEKHCDSSIVILTRFVLWINWSSDCQRHLTPNGKQFE
jgi:hypothetical protein